MTNLAADLSATELRILAAAWISCEAPPKPDYEVIAKICGYKNASSASVMYGGVRRKLVATAKGLKDGDNAADDEGATDAPAKKLPKKKRATTDPDGDKPKKRARKTKENAPSPEPTPKHEYEDHTDEKTVKQEPMNDAMDDHDAPSFSLGVPEYT